MSQAGAMEIALPPQGSVRFPKITGASTIYSVAEGATVMESTPLTAHLLLQAKAYSGLVDVPDELFRFATSVAVEAWLRMEMTKDIATKLDQEMIYGNGGVGIQGLINFSAFRTVTASTTGANGDTLDQQDPLRLHADIADQNAPIDGDFFYALTNTLWAGLMTRRSGTGGQFYFNVAAAAVGGGRVNKTLNGDKVICSTNIPTNRSKGAGTTLTLLLAGVGSEYLMARAGVVEFKVTDSDASKFASRLQTVRGTVYADGGPKHETSFGMIDTLLNS
jgi:HK97 family phage major capsid protein